jgi:hypothetical protein
MEPDQDVTLHHVDVYHAWQGLLFTAEQQFQQHDDVFNAASFAERCPRHLGRVIWSMASQKDGRFTK